MKIDVKIKELIFGQSHFQINFFKHAIKFEQVAKELYAVTINQKII